MSPLNDGNNPNTDDESWDAKKTDQEWDLLENNCSKCEKEGSPKEERFHERAPTT